MAMTKKQLELLGYRQTRNDAGNDFMRAITFNLLGNLSERNNFIHEHVAEYKNEGKPFDKAFSILAGFYICSLVSCWETFFRDLFIFTCNYDEQIKAKLQAELQGEPPTELTIGEYFAAKYNFQNLEQTRKALDKIHGRETSVISDYFPVEVFEGVIMHEYTILFHWISKGILKEKIDEVLNMAFNIRHRVTHDANFRVEVIPMEMATIESLFQLLPQFLVANLSIRYNQKRVVFNTAGQYVRWTDDPLPEEMPYAFNTKDFMAQNWQVVEPMPESTMRNNSNLA